MNATLAVQILLQIMSQSQVIAQVIATAQNENRDVTDDELNQLVTGYGAAHTALDAIIART